MRSLYCTLKGRLVVPLPRSLRLAALLVLTLAVAMTGDGPVLAGLNAEELRVAASFTDKSISPRDEIVLTLSRPLTTGEGRIAVVVGTLDVSGLLDIQGATVIYAPRILQLPEGETSVSVYLVESKNSWRQIAQFVLRVEASKQGGSLASTASPDAAVASSGSSALNASTSPSISTSSTASSATTSPSASSAVPSTGSPAQRKHGLDKADLVPSLTIGMKSQAAEAHFPDSNRPPRSTFADLTLQGSVRSDISRDNFNSQTQFNVVGSSFKQEALRFATDRNEAPEIDLASYLMQFQIGKTRVSVGQIAFGSDRHLINSFSSRGISVTSSVSKRLDLSLAAMNGTNVVGWSNFFGLSKSDHQFVTGTAGLEFMPEHRGELRFEFSLLDGRLQPVSSFNQGNITDVERSRGLGLRLLGADPSQRWRFDAGFTRSRFTNPNDPLLSQGFNVVPVREATRNASYFDGAFNVIQNKKLSDTKRATVNVNYKYEQVDPLFKSVAAFVQPDRLQNEIGVVANIADVTATIIHQRFHDNLGNIASVLKSLTRRSGFILGAPLGSLLTNPAKPSPWLPRVSYTLDDVHQFAAAIPVNGGFEFSAGSVPNQVSTNQSFSADWQVKTVRWGYRMNRSFQDNRQLGRELADFRNLTNLWSLGLQPSAKLSVNVDVGFDSSLNKEQRRTDHTFRVGPNFNWTMSKSMILTGAFSSTRIGDIAGASKNRTTEADVQWSYRFTVDKGGRKKFQGQLFFRYADRYGFAFDSVFGFRNLIRLRTLNTGINFTFF